MCWSGSGQFMRIVIEGAQLHRLQRLVAEFGLANVNLSGESVGADLGSDLFEVLTTTTADDLPERLAGTVPRQSGAAELWPSGSHSPPSETRFGRAYDPREASDLDTV